jgi:hypothetical protein
MHDDRATGSNWRRILATDYRHLVCGSNDNHPSFSAAVVIGRPDWASRGRMVRRGLTQFALNAGRTGTHYHSAGNEVRMSIAEWFVILYSADHIGSQLHRTFS